MVKNVKINCPNGDIARFEFEDQLITKEGVKIERDFTFKAKWNQRKTRIDPEIIKKHTK